MKLTYAIVAFLIGLMVLISLDPAPRTVPPVQPGPCTSEMKSGECWLAKHRLRQAQQFARQAQQQGELARMRAAEAQLLSNEAR